jgi:hypothetical protein
VGSGKGAVVIWRLAGIAVVIVLALAIAQRLFAPPLPGPPAANFAPNAAEPSAPLAAPPSPARCQSSPGYAAASGANAASSVSAQWSAFGRPELGWQVYAPLIAHELGLPCPPQSQAFAAALAAWQAHHRLPASGAMDEATLHALDVTWLLRRPFVTASAHGQCPNPPAPGDLVTAAPSEGYLGKPIQLRPAALAAYRRLVAAARAEVPAIAADPKLLTIVSGYRDPAADAADCALKGNCDTPARAGTCSAHRTGLAMDLYLGAAPGFSPASSDDVNRLYEARTPAYLWMVANAARFGFAPYPFEPWHWEWTGEPP